MNTTTSTLLNIIIILAIVWLLVLIISLLTLSLRKDMLMPVKAFWAAIIIIAPIAGLIVYLIYGTRRNRGLRKY